MISYLITIIVMIMLHIIADYNIQGWLAQSKQRKYWTDLFPNINKIDDPTHKYINDYKMCLAMHSFSWAFCIMLPILIHKVNFLTIIIFALNVVVHYYVDDLKANKLKINLVEDQLFHIAQIIITALLIL